MAESHARCFPGSNVRYMPTATAYRPSHSGLCPLYDCRSRHISSLCGRHEGAGLEQSDDPTGEYLLQAVQVDARVD